MPQNNDNKIVTCRYTACKEQNKELLQKDSYLIGNARYHKKCYEKKIAKEQIKDLYYTKINKNVVMKVLVSVINNIIDIKEVDPDFFIYALKYCIKYKVQINSPMFLHYIVADKNVLQSYKKDKAKEIKLKTNFKNSSDTTETVFSHNKKSTIGFSKNKITKKG